MVDKKVVLITGCSDGGLGSALALAFHATGKFRVIATARNLKKLTATQAKGIEELQLDVLNKESIATCVKNVEALTGGHLDMLVNNAGAGYNMPVIDINVDHAKEIFDLNVWSPFTVSRAFLPLLMKSKEAKIVNNVSVAAYAAVPVQGVYNASKAAANMLTENLRLELKPFGIRVIALMTGAVKSNFFNSATTNDEYQVLPEDSIYKIVPNGLAGMNGNGAAQQEASGMESDKWAKLVVGQLSASSPPHQIWKGDGAFTVRLGCLAPVGMLDSALVKFAKFEEVEAAVKASK